MPRRLLAFFVASVLLWSGFSTIEAPRGVAQPAVPLPGPGPGPLGATSDVLASATAATAAPAADPAAGTGSVEHHHLDDLPAQAPSDLQADTPGVLPALLALATPSLLMARPSGAAARGAGPPFLAHPLRPPCSTALMG